MTTVNNEGHTRFPELDGIRGLAILGVLLSHGASLSGLFQDPSVTNMLFRYCTVPLWGGVDLFFALSGFLITGILLKTRSRQNYFRSFYARRILRIFPIYYFVLTATLIGSHYSLKLAHQLPPTWSWKLAYFLYLQNWPQFWNGQKVMGGIWGVYWSLAVEEQFYFVWPLLVYLLSPKVIVRVSVIAVVLALPLRIMMSARYFGGDFGLAQITSSRIDGLLLGALCALYMHRNKRPVPMKFIITALCLGTMIMGFIAVFHHSELVGTSSWILTVGITGFALLSGAVVAVSQHHIPFMQRILTYPLLRTMGKYSYGIYVYHLLVFIPCSVLISRHARILLGLSFPARLLLFLLETVIVFIIAKVSFDYFESPFLRLKKFFAPGQEISAPSLSSAEA
ncbi:MAG: acyltransferase [Terracidiphilus sp.]